MAALVEQQLQQILGDGTVFRDEDFACGGGFRCGFDGYSLLIYPTEWRRSGLIAPAVCHAAI
jgi:hypothetical protein